MQPVDLVRLKDDDLEEHLEEIDLFETFAGEPDAAHRVRFIQKRVVESET